MAHLAEFLRSHALALPTLAKFAIAMAIIVCVPRLSRQVRLPAVVGLLLSGIVIGPHGLDVIGTNRPIADFFADLGKLLLMFCTGLEIDLALFRRARNRVITFGLLTTSLPLLLGTGVGFLFSYRPVAAVVLGSLLASHTLLASPIVAKLGATRLEPIAVTIGATVISDTLSLVVFAICVSTFQRGFSLSGLAVQLIEIAIFVPFIMFGLSRLGAYFLRKVADEENAYFALMLLIMTVAAALAALINLPGIVGAFLAGLAVNAAVHDQPAKEKLKFFGDSLFAPAFFVVTGFLIDPGEFYRWATNQPLIFASLGPTAYELVEQPQLPSARTFNIIVGHLIGLGSGFLAVYLLNAWAAPNVMATGVVSPERMWAMTIAAALTTFVTLVLRAGQPAALATTLLVSTGGMQTRRDAVVIVVGIFLIAAVGEPVRRFRLKNTDIRPVSS